MSLLLLMQKWESKKKTMCLSHKISSGSTVPRTSEISHISPPKSNRNLWDVIFKFCLGCQHSTMLKRYPKPLFQSKKSMTTNCSSYYNYAPCNSACHCTELCICFLSHIHRNTHIQALATHLQIIILSNPKVNLNQLND